MMKLGFRVASGSLEMIKFGFRVASGSGLIGSGSRVIGYPGMLYCVGNFSGSILCTIHLSINSKLPLLKNKTHVMVLFKNLILVDTKVGTI